MGVFKAYAEHVATRESKARMKRARKASAFADELKGLSDEALLERAQKARAEKCSDEALALALGREAVLRETGLTLTDEQLACALTLADGCVAEASTGSGKTLAAMPAAFIEVARFGKCHVVTVNEYLAGRDAAQAHAVLSRLGLTVEATYNGDGPEAKHASYAADVIYGTPSEFGFDYLRDGMAHRAADVVQTGLCAAIIDECDSVLIDEARTPLIISGARPQSVEEARLVASAVRDLEVGKDVEVDEAKRTCVLTPSGEYLVELSLPWKVRSTPLHANMIKQALIAQFCYHRDRDYIVRGGKVEIVDEQTGRVMEGRRWSDGLHAAVEAKEGVEIEPETTTMATITVQNYFRLYEHLSGMTGTAMSEDAEFERVFGMGVVRIPDHVPCVRDDMDDLFFADDKTRLAAVVEDIKKRHEKGQPVLVGTQSVEMSDEVAAALKDAGIDCTVLNARDNTAEAAVVASAGKPGRVTVSTNMAGRGTDIRLGGSPEWDANAALVALGGSLNDVSEQEREERIETARKRCQQMRDEVVAAGGLAVVSVGRNQNRRIDDQLRGRAGRQGDVGCSQYFVSFDDDLLRLFNTDSLEKAKKSLKRASGVMSSKMVAGLVEGAQERLSERDAEQRKNVLEYDDVTAAQEEQIRTWRKQFLNPTEEQVEWARKLVHDTVAKLDDPKAWAESHKVVVAPDQNPVDAIMARFESRVSELGESAPGVIAAWALICADKMWAEHLTDEDLLRNGVGLRGVAGRDPLVEYKAESARLMTEMMDALAADLTGKLVTLEIRRANERPQGGRAEAMRHQVARDGIASQLAPMAGTGKAPQPNRAQRRAAAKQAKKKVK